MDPLFLLCPSDMTNKLRPGREQSATRAAIARHKTCFMLWRAIVAHPKDSGVRLKKFEI